jgi:hypothetical protein
MGKKIENVIESCSDCRFLKGFEVINGNDDYIVVCNASEPTQIIDRLSDAPNRFTIKMPDWCPLEDYNRPILKY